MYIVPSSIIAPKPANVLVSVTDVCNLTCVQCPHVIPDTKWQHTQVPAEKIREASENAKVMSLHGAGEVLMHPHWQDYVPQPPDYAHSVGFVTNGLLFTPRNIELLISRKIDYLDISVDAGSERVYKRIRGGDWHRLWDGVDRLIAARQDGIHPKLIANMTLMMANVFDVYKLIPLLKTRGFTHLHIFHLNAKEEAVAKAWNYRFNDDSGDFNYRDQQCTLPHNLPEHDTALRTAASTAKREKFSILCSGLFFNRQGFGMPIHELVDC